MTDVSHLPARRTPFTVERGIGGYKVIKTTWEIKKTDVMTDLTRTEADTICELFNETRGAD